MKGIIYVATNLFNGKSYVGQTRVSLDRRRNQHYRDARADSVNQFHLALLQYGRDGFEWRVVDEFDGSKEEVIHALNVAEEYHILKLRSMLDENGYNATRGGYSSNVFSDRVKRLSNNGCGTRVLQYDLQGEFIREYESIREVADCFGCKSVGTSIFCKQWRGYQWRKRDGLCYPKSIGAYVKPKRSSEVVVYNPDGKLHGEYKSINLCAKDLGKRYTVKEFSERIVRPSYLSDGMIVFRKRDRDYPTRIEVTYRQPKHKESSVSQSCDIPVIQYTREGLFVDEFPSIISAHRATGICEKSIRDWCRKTPPLCIRDKRTEYIWQYKRETGIECISVVQAEKKGYHAKMDHRVIQYDSNGNIIKVWDNMYQASIHTGESHSLIRNQCKGIATKKTTPSVWRYFKDCSTSA